MNEVIKFLDLIELPNETGVAGTQNWCALI